MLRFLKVLLVGLMMTSVTSVRHSLDPLTATEISLTSKTIKKAFPGVDYLFIWITLKEPKKESLLPFFLSDLDAPVSLIPRESLTTLLDPTTGLVYEAAVKLSGEKEGILISWKQLPLGTDPGFAPIDIGNIERVVMSDLNVTRRLSFYNINFGNASSIIPEIWNYGYLGDKPAYLNKRMAQVFFYVRLFEMDNYYVRPLGFLAIVDCIAKKVVELEELPIQAGFDSSDRRGEVVQGTQSNYDPAVSGRSYRKDVSKISTSQENGPSFSIQGNLLLWQKWKMRIGRNSREGLFLHHIGYTDNGTFRPILYRASLSEIFVPYGDPRPPYHRKMAFDAGQLGLGISASELRSPDVCTGSVYFTDFIVNKAGDPVRLQNTVCVYEEDAGILWRKKDYATRRIVTARSQRLVLTFIATLGNYDYQFKWLFYQDASIKFEVTLTGIISQNPMGTGATAGGHGTPILPQTKAQFHQHFFVVRFDTEIDGNNNTAAVVDILPDPNPLTELNPYGSGFHSNLTILKTASSARTNVCVETARSWNIMAEPGNVHPINGNRRAWKLIPEFRSAHPFISKDSPLHAKAAFTDYDFWVTRYEEGQLYAGGVYLNNSGLPQWVAENPNTSTENTDIVVWHVFGLTHIPRAEDTPVMPTESVAFWFKPSNFFNENPAIDVPPYAYKSPLPEKIQP